MRNRLIAYGAGVLVSLSGLGIPYIAHTAYLLSWHSAGLQLLLPFATLGLLTFGIFRNRQLELKPLVLRAFCISVTYIALVMMTYQFCANYSPGNSINGFFFFATLLACPILYLSMYTAGYLIYSGAQAAYKFIFRDEALPEQVSTSSNTVIPDSLFALLKMIWIGGKEPYNPILLYLRRIFAVTISIGAALPLIFCWFLSFSLVLSILARSNVFFGRGESIEVTDKDFKIQLINHHEWWQIVGGAYIAARSESSVSKGWHNILSLHPDDPVELNSEEVHLVSSTVGYVFVLWMYAVTIDRGETWFVWDAEKDLPRWREDYAYGRIKTVNIAENGSGTMRLDRGGSGNNNLPEFTTTDYGRHWKPKE